MCDPTSDPRRWAALTSQAEAALSAPVPRRVLLAGALAVPLAGAASAGAAPAPGASREVSGALVPSAASVVPPPRINPRARWATNRPAKRRPVAEDVRFLLVHHTQTPNATRAAVIPGQLRGMYDYHTREKGWPDIAYNFLVDPFGGIWEGRAGSLAGPVRGDATGGSQGFAQLCCFIGDHTSTPPTPAAMTAMSALLGWLASRYGVGLAAGRRVSFVSRGSNRWKRGVRVTTDPIAAHRDMSLTECPGDALYPLVRSQLLPRARTIAGGRSVAAGAAGSGAAGAAGAAGGAAAAGCAVASGGAAVAGAATPTAGRRAGGGGASSAATESAKARSATTPATTASTTGPTAGPAAGAATTPAAGSGGASGAASAGGSDPSTAAVVASGADGSGSDLVRGALPVLGVAAIGGGAALVAHRVRARD